MIDETVVHLTIEQLLDVGKKNSKNLLMTVINRSVLYSNGSPSAVLIFNPEPHS